MLMIIDYWLSTLASISVCAHEPSKSTLYIVPSLSLSPPHYVSIRARIRVRRLSLEFQRSRNLLYKYYRATRWRRDKAIVALCTLNNRVASYAPIKHPIGVKGVAQKLNPIRLANKQSYRAKSKMRLDARNRFIRRRSYWREFIVCSSAGHTRDIISFVPRENIGAPRRRYATGGDFRRDDK